MTSSDRDLDVPFTSLIAALQHHVTNQPEAPAFSEMAGPEMSWSAFDRHVVQAAAALRARGVVAGDRVALSGEPSVHTVIAYVAILRVGAVVVPANVGYTEREIAHIVGDARPVLAFVDEDARAEHWRGAGVADVVDPSMVFESEGAAPHLTDREASFPEIAAAAPAMIGYTSGTTGTPKGAVLSHGNLVAGASSVVRAWEWDANDVLILALPLFHMHGLGVGINGTLVSGASAVVLPRFTPEAVLDAVAGRGATLFFGVPTMYARLAASPRVGELAQLRLAVSGSAPLPASIWERLRAGAGIDVLERYGMTETVMLAANPLHGERRPGTVGQPLPGVAMRLGDDGVVEVHGANVFSGYLDRPDATREAFTADGWFRTGDIGTFDTDGYLSLVGRASELIISGGYNVYPREIEDVLRCVDGVSDVAVVGAPDEEWGEIVTAFVVWSGDPPEPDWTARLSEEAERELAAFKRPRRWHRIERLPRNAMGKVVRAELVDRA